MRFKTIIPFLILWCLTAKAQQFTRKDSLRGSLNDDRTWWDVDHYTIRVEPDLKNKTISGTVQINYRIKTIHKIMQVDLQEPMKIDSVIYQHVKCNFIRIGNAYKIELPYVNDIKQNDSILISFSGKPRIARMPPWDGGLSWNKDEKGRPWIGVSCQGLGASAWWPNKDHQSDEPDHGIQISVTTPDTLVNISNGRLIRSEKKDNKIAWTYQVTNPINNYDVTFYIGKYYSEKDTFQGEEGPLTIDYCVLDYNKNRISDHLKKETHQMLRCFEHWFGAYPFYEDGYKLVESPYLGMEHQSAIAYGNKFRKGYLGRDRSESGTGMYWDFIIIHESGHEWFGNNITSKDIADMWIHESFTTYSEVLYLECLFNKDSASKYIKGLRRNISNDRNMIGPYGVNHEGSGDIYDKGANMIHNIRLILDNDSMFRLLLRELHRKFRKSTVTTEEIEKFMINFTGKDLQPIFDQYLRTTQIPQLDIKKKGKKIIYRWTNCIKGFNMPVKVLINKKAIWLYPSDNEKTLLYAEKIDSIDLNDDLYARYKVKN